MRLWSQLFEVGLDGVKSPPKWMAELRRWLKSVLIQPPLSLSQRPSGLFTSVVQKPGSTEASSVGAGWRWFGWAGSETPNGD